MPLATPVSFPLLLVVFAGFLGIAVSPLQTLSWTSLGYLVFGITLYVALVNYCQLRHHPILIAQMLILGGFLLSISAPIITDWKAQLRLFQLPIYDWLESSPYQLEETIHSNILAGYLVVVLPISLSLAFPVRIRLQDSRFFFYRVPSILYLLVSLLMIAILILTQSRGAYVASTLACFCVLVFHLHRRVAIAGGLLAMFGALLWKTNNIMVATMQRQLDEAGRMGGWYGRIDIWSQSLNAMRDYLFTGIGIGTFQNTLPYMYELSVDISSFPHAHNLFLQIALDTGLLGLIATTAILLISLTIGLATLSGPRHKSQENPSVPIPANGTYLQAEQEADSHISMTIAVGAVAALIGLMVHGIVDATVWGNRLAAAYWLVIAIINLLFINDMRQIRNGVHDSPGQETTS